MALQRQGRIGFHIGSLGEEAAILGSASATRPQDWLFPCYREFGAALWRGLPLQRYIDNMFGNANDPVKGRQMPDHYTYRAGPLRLGELAHRHADHAGRRLRVGREAQARRRSSRSPTSATARPARTDFHNGLNFAGVFKVPVVFFCRNNGWAISVPTERQTASATLRGEGRRLRRPGRARRRQRRASPSSR